MRFLSAIDMSQVMDQSRPLGERLMLGLQTIGLGMGIVFTVLILIWGACELLHYALHREDETANVAEVAPATTPAAPVADDGALIAAITAAIAATLDQPTTAFRVVSFRRTSEAGRPWNNGRTE